ncbi:MAG TPA: hypothetical protein VMD08_06740 [Candidatus Baltobacteraceae bacterium]|nr:hypothetical protein [Candidatus Baltobacteraceae bacterium]
MASIVEYTDAKAPKNLYPERIISPSRANACCFTGMEAVSPVEQDGEWEYQYTRCRTCGFTVRTILRPIPDEALLRELRRTFKNILQRNVPEL